MFYLFLKGTFLSPTSTKKESQESFDVYNMLFTHDQQNHHNIQKIKQDELNNNNNDNEIWRLVSDKLNDLSYSHRGKNNNNIE